MKKMKLETKFSNFIKSINESTDLDNLLSKEEALLDEIKTEEGNLKSNLEEIAKDFEGTWSESKDGKTHYYTLNNKYKYTVKELKDGFEVSDEDGILEEESTLSKAKKLVLSMVNQSKKEAMADSKDNDKSIISDLKAKLADVRRDIKKAKK